MPETKSELVANTLRKTGILRAKDIEALGISREYLRKLHQQGIIKRIARGLYCLPDVEFSTNHGIAEACKRVPQGVICLLSALRFHDITTQAPFEVWMAINTKARKPKEPSHLPFRIVRFSGKALEAGVEKHQIEGVTVKVYNCAKTVADCFKYRNKIGLDVALEALREGWREQRFAMDKLWQYSKICRVANVMRPYLESLSTLENRRLFTLPKTVSGKKGSK